MRTDQVRQRLAILATLLFLIPAASCGGKPRPKHYYQLTVPPAAGAAPDVAAAGIPRIEVGISAFHVDPPYDGSEIVRRAGAESVEVGFHNDRLWAAPLAKMLPVVVGEHLMQVAGGFVTAGPPAGRPLDATIDGRVLTLEEVLTPEGSKARVRLRLTVRRRNGETVWTGVAEGEADTASREPAAMAEAMQAAVLTSLDQTRPALAGALLAVARASEPATTSEED